LKRRQLQPAFNCTQKWRSTRLLCTCSLRLLRLGNQHSLRQPAELTHDRLVLKTAATLPASYVSPVTGMRPGERFPRHFGPSNQFGGRHGLRRGDDTESALLHVQKLVHKADELLPSIGVPPISVHGPDEDLLDPVSNRSHCGHRDEELVPKRPPLGRGRIREIRATGKAAAPQRAAVKLQHFVSQAYISADLSRRIDLRLRANLTVVYGKR
jgi:hypothetical protein